MVKTQILAGILIGASSVYSSTTTDCPKTNLILNPSFETGVYSPWANMSVEQLVVEGDAYNGSYFAYV